MMNVFYKYIIYPPIKQIELFTEREFHNSTVTTTLEKRRDGATKQKSEGGGQLLLPSRERLRQKLKKNPCQ